MTGPWTFIRFAPAAVFALMRRIIAQSPAANWTLATVALFVSVYCVVLSQVDAPSEFAVTTRLEAAAYAPVPPADLPTATVVRAVVASVAMLLCTDPYAASNSPANGKRNQSMSSVPVALR